MQFSNTLHNPSNQRVLSLAEAQKLRLSMLEQMKQTKFSTLIVAVEAYLTTFIVAEYTLDALLEKIYFEDYTFQQIQEYLFPALRNVKDLNSFFDILFNVIKDYANVIRKIVSC